jgi:Zn-dependent protease with chaperone function
LVADQGTVITMTTLRDWFGGLSDALAGAEFDPVLVGKSWIELGPQAERARAVAARLNRVRSGPPKQAVLVDAPGYTAVTRRGRWVYVSSGFAQRLSDDGLAFVLAHEMAHHDLGHLTLMYLSAGWLGNRQQIEFAADRLGLELAVKAGFSREGALQVLDPSWDDDLADEPYREWPPALRTYLLRFHRSHPPMSERRAALATPG